MSYLSISEHIRYRTYVKCQHETDLAVIRSVRTLTHSDVFHAAPIDVNDSAEDLASIAFGDLG
jgi:hypothetical protein